MAAPRKQPKPRKRQDISGEKIRYLVSVARGEDFVLEVAADWKITFGYVNPSNSMGGARNGEGHCLRIYEGEKLRAVFADVRGIRDLAIPLARKFVKQTGAAEWSRDSDGSFSESSSAQIEERYEADPASDAPIF